MDRRVGNDCAFLRAAFSSRRVGRSGRFARSCNRQLDADLHLSRLQPHSRLRHHVPGELDVLLQRNSRICVGQTQFLEVSVGQASAYLLLTFAPPAEFKKDRLKPVLLNLLFDFRQRFEHDVSGDRKRARIDLVERVATRVPVIEHGAFKIDHVRCRDAALKK